MMFKPLLPFALLLATATRSVFAHRPATTRASCDEDYGSSSTALPLADPTISWSFKHYLDCTHRAVWIQFENQRPDQPFYVGVGIPPQDRFAAVRASALIIGPGLPALTAEEWAQVPEDVRNDPIWNSGSNIGAYFHASPEDQSTCDHLGTVMQGSSTVLNGRCDFYEPFGRTHSWRVLDADENILPEGNGATYHVAVFLQDDTSSKLGIALGTWVENFITRYEIDTPTCTRNVDDFSEEKRGLQEDCFPVVSCPAAQRPIGCEEVSDIPAAPICELGQVCNNEEDCVVAGMEYKAPTMGACGGELCPAAVHIWEDINAKMHQGMMDIEYTGNPEIDFVRGMIPHHIGAVDMCQGLIQNLTCTEIEDADTLEGLVHFCNHVQLEQEIEVGGMRAWLDAKNISELAPCSEEVAMTKQAHDNHNNMDHMGHNMEGVAMGSGSCGDVTAPSSEKLIQVNHKMHELMAVRYSCDHSLDFVRMMLPHHAGAVDMCDILMESTQDNYLIELCDNITLTQRAEVAWMYEWLEARDQLATAPCSDNCILDTASLQAIGGLRGVPCEDTLSTTSFCHGIAGQSQDGYCRCNNETFAANGYSCDEPTWVDGFGLFVPDVYCRRSCGQCPMDSRPLWVPSCAQLADVELSKDHGNHDMMGGRNDDGEMVKSSTPSSSCGKAHGFLALVLSGLALGAAMM